MDAVDTNLTHVLIGDCTDPDCEIHNPEVGLAEGTVTPTHVAFYLAGAYNLVNLMDNVEGNEDEPVPTTEYIQSVALAELRDQLGISLQG